MSKKNQCIIVVIVGVVLLISILLILTKPWDKEEPNPSQNNGTIEPSIEEQEEKDPVIPENKPPREFSNIEIINYNELRSKIDNKETFIIIVTQTGCIHCERYRPVINKVAKKNKLTIYEINGANDNYAYYTKITNDVGGMTGTPTTSFIINGEPLDYDTKIVGEATVEQTEEKIKNAGFIK